MHTDITITKAVEGYIVCVQVSADPINNLRAPISQHVFLTLDEVKAFISTSLDASTDPIETAPVATTEAVPEE